MSHPTWDRIESIECPACGAAPGCSCVVSDPLGPDVFPIDGLHFHRLRIGAIDAMDGRGARGRPLLLPPKCKACGRDKKRREDKNRGFHCKSCQKRRSGKRRQDARVAGVALSRGPARQEIAAMVAIIKAEPCADCGGRFPAESMDFDHRPGEIKVNCVGQMYQYSKIDVMAEIAKCDLVCSNCHRVRTRRRSRRSTGGSTPL